MDWTLCHAQMIRWHVRNKLAAKFARGERVIEYWRKSDDAAAKHLCEETISQLLWGCL